MGKNDKDKPTDNYTLPAAATSNRTEAYVEALILAGIANKIATRLLPKCYQIHIQLQHTELMGLHKVASEINSFNHPQTMKNKGHFPQRVY